MGNDDVEAATAAPDEEVEKVEVAKSAKDARQHSDVGRDWSKGVGNHKVRTSLQQARFTYLWDQGIL